MTLRCQSKQEAARGWWRALAACAGGALCLAGIAGAANSASFTDRARDVLLAPDITRLDVSNDDKGTISIRVATGGGLTLGLPGEELAVALDLDQNPDTGTVYYGTDVAFALAFGLEGDRVEFAHAAGARFSSAPPPASLRATASDGAVTFSIDTADLGLAPTAGVNIVAVSGTSVTDDEDLAPDMRTFNYQLVAGTPPPPLPFDKRAPLDRAFASRGVHGKVAQLVYAAQDGRGVTADTVRVYGRRRLLKTMRISLGDASPFFAYYARWRVPRNVHGRLRFCVSSVDAAGNKSNTSCAPLVVR